MEYIFIYEKDTSYAEWETLLSKCTERIDPNPTTIRYCVSNNSFKCSCEKLYKTSNWIRARSYQQFMEHVFESLLEK